MVKIYRCALMDAATKGNAGKQRREGTEGQIGTGTETEIVDPIGVGEVFLDITRFIITMNKIWQKINGLELSCCKRWQKKSQPRNWLGD